MRYFNRTSLAAAFTLVAMVDCVFGLAAWRERGFAKWFGVAIACAFVPLDAYVIYGLVKLPTSENARYRRTQPPLLS